MALTRRGTDTMFAAIWLVFLINPASAAFTPGVPTWARAVWVVGFLVFVAVYLVAFAAEELVPGRGRAAHLAVASAGMLLGAALMIPASQVATVYVTPYLMALWTFRWPGRVGVWVAIGVLAAGLLSALVWGGQLGTPLVWLIAPQVIAYVMVMGSSWLEQYQERLARVREEARLSAEREGIARDVHDLLGHSLTVVAVKAELARKLVHVDPQRAEAELDDILATTRESLAQVRGTVGRLRTPDLPGQLAATATALAAADIRADLPGPTAVDRVPESCREVMAWCLREAVTNVVRHSGAQRCTVELEPATLRVTDDGRGRGARPPGAGLAGMQERVEVSGGTLEVADRPGGGTRVEVRW